MAATTTPRAAVEAHAPAAGAAAPIVGAAAVLTAIDIAGRLLISSRLPGRLDVAPLDAAVVFGVLMALFVAGQRVRHDAIVLLVPLAGLGVVGDLVAQRMAAGGLPEAHGGQGLGVVVLLAALWLFADHRRNRALGPLLAVAGVVLVALPVLPVIGWKPVEGQYINAGLFGLVAQPAELGRPLVLIGMAAMLADLPLPPGGRLDLADFRPQLKRALIAPTMAILFMLLARDLGPAALMAAATLIVVVVTTGKAWHLAVAVGVLGAVLLVGLLLGGERIETRFSDVVHPLAGSAEGAQSALARQWLAWGGFDGIGLGAGAVGTAKSAMLPAQQTDLALVAWGTEMGLAGIVGVLALEVALIWGLFTLALRAPAGFFRLSGCAVATLVAVQAGWVVGATMGMLPLTGISVPAVSTGRSAALGLAVISAWALRLPVASAAESPVRGVDPARIVRALRLCAVTVLLGGVLLGGAQLLRTASHINQISDNHVAWLAGWVGRGEVRTAAGERLAWTAKPRSFDTARRQYAAPDIADLVGRSGLGVPGTGLEGAYSAALRCAGSGQAPADRPSLISTGDPSACQPADVVTTLDLHLQRSLSRALQGRSGAIVVLDPRNGAVRALVGERAGARDPQNLEMAARLAIAPGSTFKIVTAASMLRSHSRPEVPVSVSWRVPGGPLLGNAGGMSCGGGSLPLAFAVSCNTAFAQYGVRVGGPTLAETAQLLGASGPMPLSGLPATAGQVFQDAEPSTATVAAGAIGQGTDALTALGMARMTATIANGGRRVAPTLVAAVCDGDHERYALPGRTQGQAGGGTSPPVARSVASMMRGVTVSGTGRRLKAPGRWALKTGTAELPALPVSPAGTAGAVVGFPTEGSAAGRLAVAIVVLPDAENSQRSGAIDAVGLLTRVAPVLTAAAKRPSAADCDD